MLYDEKYPCDYMLANESRHSGIDDLALIEEKSANDREFTGMIGIEIKGKVKTLSPNLWTFTKISRLYLNDNELCYIPPDIGNLTNLTYLNLSHNYLTSLPCEIGDLCHLKELFLDHNQLQSLPYELGKLHLVYIGLTDNPLQEELMSLYLRSGTAEVMKYLREKWNELHPPATQESVNSDAGVKIVIRDVYQSTISTFDVP